MESDTCGFTPFNLLLVVLVFGLVLLFPWSELWRKRMMVGAAAKAPRPLKPKSRADCPLCQVEQGQ